MSTVQVEYELRRAPLSTAGVIVFTGLAVLFGVGARATKPDGSPVSDVQGVYAVISAVSAALALASLVSAEAFEDPLGRLQDRLAPREASEPEQTGGN